jgi:hypothetical protein
VTYLENITWLLLLITVGNPQGALIDTYKKYEDCARDARLYNSGKNFRDEVLVCRREVKK